MKFACFSETTAPPIRSPFRPAASISRPAEIARRIAEDAARRGQPERLVGLPPVADLVEPRLDHVRVRGLEPERRVDHHVTRRIGDSVVVGTLEPTVAVGQPELARRDDHLGPVRLQDARRLEDTRHVRVVGARVGPHRAADRARDRQPELEPGQAGVLGLGRGPGHLDAGLGRVAIAVGPRSLRPGPG